MAAANSGLKKEEQDNVILCTIEEEGVAPEQQDLLFITTSEGSKEFTLRQVCHSKIMLQRT